MIEVLTGLGLAMSAGLNAYIPLLLLGLLDRYAPFVELSGPWAWLGNGWVLLVLAVLLVLEVGADKIPGVDHVNDLVQVLVRPVTGAVAFTAGATTMTPGNSAPSQITEGMLLPFLAGLVIALTIHLLKAGARSVLNWTSGGLAAPVLSTMEDVAAVVLAAAAILVPQLVTLLVLIGAGLGVWLYRLKRESSRRAAVSRSSTEAAP